MVAHSFQSLALPTLFTISMTLFPMAAWASDAAVGSSPPEITLTGDLGSRVSGEDWSSSELKDKVHVLFYVSPDKSDVNDAFTEALRDAAFDRDVFGSVAVINMAASRMPNFAINMALRSRQREFPNTIYVRDFKSVLVNEWGLADNESVVVIFAPDGKIIFRKDGQLDESEIASAIATIGTHLPGSAN